MKIPMHQIAGISKLVQDYFADYDKVAEFYNGDYRNAGTFFTHANELRQRSLAIEELVAILAEQNKTFGCGHQTIDKIALLQKGACAVVTGQQTGLFGGPLFTIYKALTAIKLSERLSRTCDDCFVPVFWLASDDHDFREVNHCIITDKSNALKRITYSGHHEDSHLPISDIILNDSIAEALKELEDNTHPTEFKSAVMSVLSAAYQPGGSFSTGFALWIMQLFKAFGLIVIDGSDARLKSLSSGLFRQEVEENSPSTLQGQKISEKLIKAGYHNQVNIGDGFLNLFYIEHERQSIQHVDDLYTLKRSGKKISKTEISKLLRDNPEAFSPNVLLRPLYQDTLLPTVAYVAGPAETAYYAQMKGIYHAFDIPMPIIYPRKSITLLESKIEKVLDKYALKVTDLWGNIDTLITDITKQQLPSDLEENLENTTSEMIKQFEIFEHTVIELDKSLADTAKNIKSRIRGQMETMEKKILQAYKKRNDVMRQQIYKAQNSLNPNSQLQEREFNVIPYLFKYGFEFIDRIYEAVDISDFEHQIIRI